MGQDLAYFHRVSFALQDRGSQRLLAEAGHPVTALPWWRAYREHVERRHNVVHRGAKLSEEDARASVDVMWELVEFMRGVRASVQRANGPPT